MPRRGQLNAVGDRTYRKDGMSRQCPGLLTNRQKFLRRAPWNRGIGGVEPNSPIVETKDRRLLLQTIQKESHIYHDGGTEK